MRCARCGSEISDNARFCPRCGAAVGEAEQAPPAPEPGPQAAADPVQTGEKPERPKRRRRTVLIVVVVVAVVAALGVAAWLLLPGLLGPKTVLVLREDVPDEAFRTYLVQHVDVDGNGEIDQEEADAVTAFGDASAGSSEGNGLSGLGIASLEGLSAFTNLTQVVCEDNQLTELDVSGLPNLTALDCSSNQLTSLDVSGASGLERLDCANNQLTGLDLSAQTDLTALDCSSNQLTSLDVSASGSLGSLSCDGNAPLVALALPQGDALTTLHATDCGLTSVDLSGLPGLTDVLLDAGAQVTGDVADVDDQTRDNLELLASLYIYSAEPMPARQTVTDLRAGPGDGTLDVDLVCTALSAGWEFTLTHGETNAEVAGDPLGVSTSSDPGVSVSTDDAGVAAVLSTFYGAAPDDLSYLEGVATYFSRDAATGIWTVNTGVAPIEEAVWTGNFTSYGNYLSYDVALFVLHYTGDPGLLYYHVVAQKSDASRLGYRMVSLSAAGDLSASFPDAAAAYDSYVSMPVADLTGDWYTTAYGTQTLSLSADGTCSMFVSGEWAGDTEKVTGTWEYADASTVRVHAGDDSLVLSYDPATGQMTDDQGRPWAPLA